MGLKIPKKPQYLDSYHYLVCLAVPWKPHCQGSSLFDLTGSLLTDFSPEAFVENNQWQLFLIAAA